MAAFVIQCCDHEIGCAIDDLGLVREIRGRIDETHQFDNPHQTVDVASASSFQLRQKADRTGLRRLCTGFGIHVHTQFAPDHAISIRCDLTRHMDQIADHDLEAWLVVDASATMHFGTVPNTKADTALAATAAIATTRSCSGHT